MLRRAQDQGFKELYTSLIKITPPRKGRILWLTTVLFTSSSRCFHAMKIPDAKEAVEKWEKLEKILEWQLKQGLRAEKFTLRHSWTFAISRIRSWNHNFKKYKGRLVLRGDIVEDDSGSYAVFTEQGSSASQMTAAKVMDIIPRLLVRSGQAADAISACTPVKIEDAPTLLRIPNSECGPVWKIQSICTVTVWQDCYGRGNLWRFHGCGKVCKLGMFICQPNKRTIPVSVCGRDQNGWKNRKPGTHLENVDERRWFGRTNVVPWQRVFGMYSKRLYNK